MAWLFMNDCVAILIRNWVIFRHLWIDNIWNWQDK